MADDKNGTKFEPDAEIAAIAEAYALDTVDMMRERYRIALDWTDQSIDGIELALSDMHKSYRLQRPRPSDDMVMSYAKLFGSYVGELFRRNHGGEWGMVTLGGQTFPGFRSTSGHLFWPWGRARNRLVQGPEDNVAHYYQNLIAD